MQEDEERPHAFTAADLRALHAASAESPERTAAHRWRRMLNGGQLPALDSMSEVPILAAYALNDTRSIKAMSRVWLSYIPNLVACIHTAVSCRNRTATHISKQDERMENGKAPLWILHECPSYIAFH